MVALAAASPLGISLSVRVAKVGRFLRDARLFDAGQHKRSRAGLRVILIAILFLLGYVSLIAAALHA